MEFEWDEAKRRTNLEKHGVDLLDGAIIFQGQLVTFEDQRFDYGEPRLVSIGLVEGQYYVVVHTKRDGVTRLISTRKGGRRDKRRYQAGIAG